MLVDKFRERGNVLGGVGAGNHHGRARQKSAKNFPEKVCESSGRFGAGPLAFLPGVLFPHPLKAVAETGVAQANPFGPPR